MSTATSPSVVALFLCVGHDQPLRGVEQVSAVANQGLEGDLHARPNSKRQVLLVEHEVLDQLGLAPGQVREQVTTRGLDLVALASGARIRAGTAVLEVAGPCAPCELMDRIRPGLRVTLEGRRGRFVRVLTPGTFAVGDPLVIEPPA